MNDATPNAHGLFDAPVRTIEKKRVTLTQADIERQLDAGAFLMSHEEAVATGLLNPLEESESILVDIAREDA